MNSFKLDMTDSQLGFDIEGTILLAKMYNMEKFGKIAAYLCAKVRH